MVRRSFGFVGLFVLGMLLGAVVCEGVVRLVAPQQLILLDERIWQPDSVLGWAHVPNASVQVNVGERTVWFVSDSVGHRQNRQPDSVAPYDASILFLGDSFLEALQVENEETFPEIIKRQLNETHVVRIRVVNAGVGGWSPNQYYLQAKRELERNTFDAAVICLYVGNDFQSRFDTVLTPRRPVERHRLRVPSSFTFAELREKLLYPVNDFLETRSHLFILFRNRSQTFLSKVGLTATYFPPIFDRSYERSGIWETTALICERIKTLCESHGVVPLFFLIPAPFQVQKEVFEDYVRGFGLDPSTLDLEQPNKLFAAALKQRGITIADPLDYMREQSREGKSLFGSIDSHFNRNGHQAAAEFLLPYLEAMIAR